MQTTTSTLKEALLTLPLQPESDSKELNQQIEQILRDTGYGVFVADHERPWGGFNRLPDESANRFIAEFFPDIDPLAARLGNKDVPLSPKILLVAPGARLSWQYHERRAERWVFLTDGAYYKSSNDEQGELHQALAGDVVQFAQGERHRLVGAEGHYTLVAEIWQHTDATRPSEEEDIIRVADDYRR